MKLKENEIKVLKLMVENPQVTNAEIAAKLDVTTQAVGKIKRKLGNKGIIKDYETVVDYDKMGIGLFAIALIRIMPKAYKKYPRAQLKKLLEPPNVVSLYAVPQTTISHIVVYAFRDVAEFDDYFRQLQRELADLIEIRESYVFSSASLIKDSSKELLVKTLDEILVETTAKRHQPQRK